MKKIFFLPLIFSYVLHAETAETVKSNPADTLKRNPYTLSEKIKQSTIHDAIQIYYAKRGFTFYFKRARSVSGGESFEDFEVIDLVNSKNLGSIGNFAEDLGVVSNTGLFNYKELMKKFLDKYNGRFTYVMTKLVESNKDQTDSMCRAIMKEILRRNANIETLDNEILAEAYKDNKYFDLKTDTVINDVVRKAADSAQMNLMLAGALMKGTGFKDVGGAGGLAGNVATGAARFLIERANQEINAAFFRRLKQAMDSTEELQKLFPEAYELTSSLETYNFDAAINALRTKLVSDLENILGNISRLAEIKKYEDKLNEVPELTYVFAICDLMNELHLEHSPGQIIHKIYTSPYVRKPTTNEANVFKLAGYLSFSLRDVMLCDATTDTKGWISPAELNYSRAGLLEIFKYYVGLLQQSDPGIVFNLTNGKDYSFRQCAIDMRQRVAQISGFISATFKSVELINKEMAAIRMARDHEVTPDLIDLTKFEHYKNISIEILNMVEQTVSFPDLIPSTEQEKILKVITDLKLVYVPATNKAILVASNLEKKEYNEAVFNIGELLNIFIERFNTNASKKTISKNTELVSKLFKYGQFFASVATAENGDDVKEAINSIALPTGSSSLKKDLAFNVAVNGYIGYFSRHIKEDDAFVQGFTQSYGITAPIGFTMSAGLRKGGSLSLFTGIIDVGAIAQYELKEDQTTGATTAEPTIEWGNIISPSVHLVYGFPFYLPLSTGFGYQWLANSANISGEEYTLKARFNFFICFDIPIVNVVSRKRVKR